MKRLAGVVVLLAIGAATVVAPALPAADAVWPADRQPHPGIRVEGDEDFTKPLSGVSGGRGTADDPYRIRDLHILPTNSYAIRLVNTTAHVLIENVTFEGDLAGPATHVDRRLDPGSGEGIVGLDLQNVTHVIIRNLTVEVATVGVLVRDAVDVTVENAQFGRDVMWYNWVVFGVLVSDSRDVTVTDMRTTHTSIPASVVNSTNVEVAHSTMRSPGSHVIAGRGSSDVRIVHNAFDGTGVYTQGEIRDLVVAHNTIRDSGSSIRVNDAAANVTICGNVVTRPDGSAGILVAHGENVRIVGNDITDARYRGLAVEGGADVTVLDNRVARSGSYGADLLVANMTVHGNAFVDNADPVVLVDGAAATRNWWGHASGPSGLGPGSGQAIAALPTHDVAFEPWLEAPPELDFTCPRERLT